MRQMTVILPLLCVSFLVGSDAADRSRQAMSELASIRDGLHARLTQARSASGIEVQIWPEDAFLYHPIMRNETLLTRFAPVRETPRLRLRRLDGRWFGPELGQVTTRFKEQFHLTAMEAKDLTVDDAGLAGVLALTAMCKDVRYELPTSSEGCDPALTDLRYQGGGGGRGEWGEWYSGSKERIAAQTRRLELDARQRRGWILDLRLASSSGRVIAVWAWIEDGRVQRGWGWNLVGGIRATHDPELRSFSLKDGRLEAELELLIGSDPWYPKRRIEQRWRWTCPVDSGRGGCFRGQAWSEGDEGAGSWAVEGRLARAYAGKVSGSGLDAFRDHGLLAAVMPLPDAPEPLPALDLSVAGETDAVETGMALWRQIQALAIAVRDPLADWTQALRDLETGDDDRWRFYPRGGHGLNSRRETQGFHRALTHALAVAAGGPAAYLDGLLSQARAAAGAIETPWLRGAVASPDPEFGPFTPAAATAILPRDPQGGSRLEALPEAASAQRWALLDDWFCAGFIYRSTNFDTPPDLPEVFVPARPSEGLLPASGPLRVPLNDPSEHVWFWQGRLEAPWMRIGIPRQVLGQSSRWGHPLPEGTCFQKDYDYFTTWYASSRLILPAAGRVWMAATVNWDGRLWVNDRPVWRPDRSHSAGTVAVFPVDLVAGVNRLTVCVTPQRIGVGNAGNWHSHAWKYGERLYGDFSVWLCQAGAPRSAPPAPAPAPTPAAVRGARGDGSGRYPEADPPLAWDIKKEINLRWKAELPTDDAEPVIIGDRIFLPCFTGDLACLDATTGKEFWRARPTVPVAEDPWKEAQAEFPGLDPLVRLAPDPAAVAQDRLNQGWRDALPALRRQCLPVVADAAWVWMHDPRGAVSCYDHQGKRRWEVAVPPQAPRVVSGHYAGTRLVPLTPPGLAGDRLVVAVGAGLMALDPATGHTRWRRERLFSWAGQFSLLHLDDAPQGRLAVLGSGEVLDLADGATVYAEAAPVMPDCPTAPLVDGATAYLFGTSAAIRFGRDAGGTLTCRLLWNVPTDVHKRGSDANHTMGWGGSPDFFAMGAFPPVPVLHDGVLMTSLSEMNALGHGPKSWSRFHAYDAATGSALGSVLPTIENAMHPVASMALAKDLVYAGDEGGFVDMAYRDFPVDVPFIAVLQAAAPRPVRLAVSAGLASRAPPVFSGRRMYLAGSGQVVCCERPEKYGDLFSPTEIRELNDRFVGRELGTVPGRVKDPVVIPALDRLPADAQVPVAELCEAFPGRWLMAGPLPLAKLEDPFVAMNGRREGALVVTGTAIQVSGQKAEFRPVGRPVIDYDDTESDNMIFGTGINHSSYAISPQQVFTTGASGKAWFAVVLYNRRPRVMACRALMGVRYFVAGVHLTAEEPYQLQRGFYPVLIEVSQVRLPPGRSGGDRQRIDRILRLVADPRQERAAFLERAAPHRVLLRRLVESGRAAGIPIEMAANALNRVEQAQSEGVRP